MTLLPGAHTYSASGTAYGAYATPTDMVTLVGSSTKDIVVLNAMIGIQSTAAALQVIDFIKRSTANTSGTLTNPTPFKFDSASPAATATVNLYTAAPTLGDSAGVHKTLTTSSATLTTSPTFVGPFGSNTFHSLFNTNDIKRPIWLRNANESYCINYRGAALTAGFAALWYLEWAEYAD